MNKLFLLIIYFILCIVVVPLSIVKAETTAEPVVLDCCNPINDAKTLKFGDAKKAKAKTFFRSGEPKIQLSLTLNGIWAEGFTFNDGLITHQYEEYFPKSTEMYRILEQMSPQDKKIIRDVSTQRIFVEAQCVVLQPLSKGTEMKPGETLSCAKGEGVFVKYISPECTQKDKIDRKAMFTLISTGDDNEGNAKLAQAVAVSQQNGVPEGQDLPNGNGMQAARATPENETATARPVYGATANTRLVRNGLRGEPDAAGSKSSCCLWPWGSS